MRPITRRGFALLLTVALATATLAPAAQADRGWGHRRFRGGPRVVRVVHGPMFVERGSHADALVGFLGGLVLGSVLSSRHPASPPPAYEYYDPYGHNRYASLDDYDRYDHDGRYPATLEVIEVHSGRCVDRLERIDDRWVSRYDRGRYERDDEGHPPYEPWGGGE